MFVKVNDMDMSGVTREEAVLYLLSLQDQIDLIVQYRKEEYEQIVQNQDSTHLVYVQGEILKHSCYYYYYYYHYHYHYYHKNTLIALYFYKPSFENDSIYNFISIIYSQSWYVYREYDWCLGPTWWFLI